MVEIQCDIRKAGCGKTYRLDKDNNKNQRYIECPYCGRIISNPFYEGEGG